MAEAAGMNREGAGGMQAVMDGFSSLAVLRQLGLLVGLAASVAIGFGVVLWAQSPDYAPLYTDASRLNPAEVASLLQKENIPYKVDTQNSMILVDASKLHDARMKLASAGLPVGNLQGYEILDQASSFGTSQFMEKARYNRSLEGELARTITSVSTIRGARVHLAIPKKSVLVTDKRSPRASVFVELFPGRRLAPAQVQSIVHLVASSVPELDRKDVTVIDQHGQLLSEDEKDEDVRMVNKQFEYSRRLEDLYIGRVNSILTPLLGEDRFKVQVALDIDYTAKQDTAEMYNPAQTVIRSEQTLDERRGNGLMAGGVPGALSNQPPAEAIVPEVAAGEPGSAEATENKSRGNSRTQTTRNYEVDRTISHTRHAVGTVERVSVAVVVDDEKVERVLEEAPKKDKKKKKKKGAKPETTIEFVAVKPEVIERMTTLVKDAIGFDQERGDSVTIINQRFMQAKAEIPDMPDIVEPALWEQPWFMRIVRQVGGVVLLLILVFSVLRPIMKNLASASPVAETAVAPALTFSETPALSQLGDGRSDFTSQAESLLPGPDTSYDEQLNTVKGMVAEDPRRVAQVVKTWINKDD